VPEYVEHAILDSTKLRGEMSQKNRLFLLKIPGLDHKVRYIKSLHFV